MPSGPRMGAGVLGKHLERLQVRIELGGGQVRMPQQGLNMAKVRSLGQEVGREGMAEQIRAHPAQPGGPGRCFHDLVDTVDRESGLAA